MTPDKNPISFHSQFGEDYLLSQIFQDQTDGICVEVGANDGINDSTTLYFEQIGWRCILVEPNPELCKTIRSNRSSNLFECAASDYVGESTLLVASGAERAHGVSALSDQPDAKEKIGSYGFACEPVTVSTNTLTNILDSAGIEQQIHFITIDVEGQELNVLKGIDFSRWKPIILIVEDNSNFENNEVRDYLHNFGYRRFKRTVVNDWYAQSTNEALVNFKSVTGYHFKCFKARLKTRVKKIPGLVYVVRLLKGSKFLPPRENP